MLEKSLEHVVGRIDDEQDEQLENLASLNEQLAGENAELRLGMHENQEVQQKVEELVQEIDRLELELEDARADRETTLAAMTM